MQHRSWLSVALLLALAAAPRTGWLQVTPADIPLLPPYCADKVGGKHGIPNSGRNWAAVFGAENWLHMHHYCFGINQLNHARTASGSQADRQWHAMKAYGEIDYVLTHGNPASWPLLPEAYLNQGHALLIQGKDAEALQRFQLAMAAKPDYAPPYVAVSDYLAEQGDAARAREVLEQGLAQAPGSRLLKRRLERLSAP